MDDDVDVIPVSLEVSDTTKETEKSRKKTSPPKKREKSKERSPPSAKKADGKRPAATEASGKGKTAAGRRKEVPVETPQLELMKMKEKIENSQSQVRVFVLRV